MNDHDNDFSDSSSSSQVSSQSESSSNEKQTFSRKKRIQPESSRIIVQSSFDAYFTYSSSRAQTSNSVFSSLIPPLSQEEYAEASKFFPPPLQSDILTLSSRTNLFKRFIYELVEGWNVLCYGFGSKRVLLNHFALHIANSKDKLGKGHVVVINAFQPDFVFKDLLYAIEQNVPGLTEFQPSSVASGFTSMDVQIHRIKEFFRFSSRSGSEQDSTSQPKTKASKNTPLKSTRKHRDLYIIIHNIDASSLRSQKVQSALSTLAMEPHIHIVASVDHINAPLMWSTSDIAARKKREDDPSSSSSPNTAMSPQGFAWLYHDCTTLLPYDVELSHIDPSSIKLRSTSSGLSNILGHGTGGGEGSAAAVVAGGISETAALHVLASVTQKAKKLFLWMAKRQIESMGAEGGGTSNNGSSNNNTTDPSAHSIPYSTVFTLARDEFLATNTIALRALLGEFRDHGLVVGKGGDKNASGGEEMLWIPMRKERLLKVAKEVEKGG